ncbi:MAG: 3-oxoacid CoA-transferase subunit A [Chloroflexi bacterium]|nr:3-oxoacid CoA-transferase subunit A [Chloroflexota bacterium]
MPGKPVFSDPAQATADIPAGATIMVGGFTGRGVPVALLRALRDRGVGGLTIVTNDLSGGWSPWEDAALLVEAGLVRKVIASFPIPGSASTPTAFERLHREGKIELELLPQGTLVERIRAAGAGIGGFYTPTGVGTPFAEGKEVRVIDGQEYLFELPLPADFALIRAHRADVLGNLVYRRAARNFNPTMATAARVTIVQVEEALPAGALDPEAVVTPGIYVQRLVLVGGAA